MGERSRLGTACASAVTWMQRGIKDYLLEWQQPDERDAKRLRESLLFCAAAVNKSDVVCWLKPGGLCPFCNMSIALLKKLQERKGFSLETLDLMHDEREALKLALGVTGVLTYPVIFVRGVHVEGGFTELKRECESDSLEALLNAPRAPFEPTLPQLPGAGCQRPKLLHQAGGGRWCTYHLRIYGNVLRVHAALQVGLFALSLALTRAAQPLAGAIVLIALGFDAILFCLVGNAPFSPLGLLSTVLIWQRRGAVVTATPYKVVFLYYALTCLAFLPCVLNGSVADASPSNMTMCDGLFGQNQESLASSLLVNSTLLAILRF
jgi:glutaredoxin